MLEKGTILNETYRIEEQIGSGGGGVVYKAYHERLHTEVVVKQIKDKVKGILESRAEADILKRIKHSRLPRVYDFLEIDGEIYTVMDFISGKSLDEALKEEKRFNSNEVLQWALQLADALDYLHKQTPAIIHSDIKPANIMLLPDRSVCLIDFNVSLAFDEGIRTSIGVSGGYSPPEQYRSRESYYQNSKILRNRRAKYVASDTTVIETTFDETEIVCTNNELFNEAERLIGKGIDERSDIYSLGATLYHLLTGVKPYRNVEEVENLKAFKIEIGDGFAAIIEKMLSVSPEKRYQNGGELLYALENIYELDSEYRKYKIRRKLEIILNGALYLLGVILIAVGIIMHRQEIRNVYYQNIVSAEELIKQSEFEQAKECIDYAEVLLPERIEAYEKELFRLYSMGNYEESIKYGTAIINNPSYIITEQSEDMVLADIFYLMGNAYFELKDYGNSIPYLSMAIERNQSNSAYYRDYAVANAKQGYIEVAEDALKTAVTLDLGEDSIYMVQGEIAVAKNENEESVQYLEKSIQITEDKNILRRGTLLCASVYEKLGNEFIDREIELLEKNENRLGVAEATRISEKLAELYAKKAQQVDDGAQWYAKSLEKFQKLYEQGYATRQMMENIAIVYEEMNMFDESETQIFQMIEKYPEDYRGYKRLAYLEADKQQEKANENRSYLKMKEYYEKAALLYKTSKSEGDTEMQMLENMIKDLKSGGWF